MSSNLINYNDVVKLIQEESSPKMIKNCENLITSRLLDRLRKLKDGKSIKEILANK